MNPLQKFLDIGATPAEAAQLVNDFKEGVDVRKQLDQFRNIRAGWRQKLLCRGIPEIHLRHVYDVAPRETDALREVKEWLRGDKTFLFLTGTLGTGKSAAAAWAACYEDRSVFVTAFDLREVFGFDDSAVRQQQLLRNTDLLVVDDLGMETNDTKGWWSQNFNGLLGARYSSCLRTIITGNIDPTDFKTRYPFLADRVREVGDFVLVGGKSMRGE